MSGLDAAIRERMQHPGDAFDHIINGYGWLRRALVAVLDTHATTDLGDGRPYCAECSSRAGVRVFEPCRTKQAIAKALGIEVTGG